MSKAASLEQQAHVRLRARSGVLRNVRRYWALYVMALPGFVFFMMFKYVPLAGSVIAFKDYMIFKGFLDSPWVGLKHFQAFFEYPDFWRVFKNTLLIGAYNLFFVFPFPIALGLLFNELRNVVYKRSLQTIYYVPHFFSWVIIAGITFDVLSNTGIVNSLRALFGLEPILFMQEEKYFRFIVVLTSIWRDAGWGTIVLLAAIAGINPEVYESALVDGAGRIRQIFSITLPLIMPTVIVLFLLQIGNFLDLSFDQIYNLLTPMTFAVGDVIDTYVYRVGIVEAQYSSTTAVGLFQSVIGLVMVLTFNQLAKRYQQDGGLF
ncbi:putative aldouronate transport system permease protein [Paenibacillus sp. UNCCL117]|uniref:ABC transporter permease n=1 Tax=unclassified Paenibacillus TaxID=185978 RepID=UPI00087F96C9|nr:MULTISPECIES: ABC transporter permease subunit [unclassified Paenibacillus]SDE02622.1 putative aldouronate transport system permease protein [Paenibacillus sp. cl123]SFW57253.1 putative aldouronate transport system permease protein [Paenibacillus sp. UNCCL117]